MKYFLWITLWYRKVAKYFSRFADGIEADFWNNYINSLFDNYYQTCINYYHFSHLQYKYYSPIVSFFLISQRTSHLDHLLFYIIDHVSVALWTKNNTELFCKNFPFFGVFKIVCKFTFTAPGTILINIQ